MAFFFAVVKPHSLVNPPLVSQEAEQEAAFLFVAHAHKPSSFLVYALFCCPFSCLSFLRNYDWLSFQERENFIWNK